MKYILTLSLLLGTMSAQAVVTVNPNGTATIDKWGTQKKITFAKKGVR